MDPVYLGVQVGDLSGYQQMELNALCRMLLAQVPSLHLHLFVHQHPPVASPPPSTLLSSGQQLGAWAHTRGSVKSPAEQET